MEGRYTCRYMDGKALGAQGRRRLCRKEVWPYPSEQNRSEQTQGHRMLHSVGDKLPGKEEEV